MRRLTFLVATTIALASSIAHAQSALPLTLQEPTSPARPPVINPLSQPTVPPGVIELLTLDGKFAQDVAKRGGKAFASWFAEDAVMLNNGKPAVQGLRAITAASQWDSATYRLTWVPQGAQMGPSGDTGFTWGHYEAHSVDKNGEALASSGRYITFWKKLPDGSWKVAMDAGSNDAPAEGDCCALPKP